MKRSNAKKMESAGVIATSRYRKKTSASRKERRIKAKAVRKLRRAE